ncbi:MAG TPA: hypothetical protein VHF69_11780, partial [Candidatus Synoicihabitans sp.]|nr:hypothetical protein [Candidatus Synoicihabitans sp.]
DYAALVHAGARGVKRGNPDAQVVLGGLAWDLDYLRDLLEGFDVASSVDVVNIHSYFETWHEDPIEMLPQYIEEAAQLVHRFGEGEPLWMAEVGYSSRTSRAGVTELYRPRFRNEHTADYQASALVRTIFLSASTGRLSLLAWYRINDLPPTQDVIGDDHNRHLGIVDAFGNPKPAFTSFRWLTSLFSQPYRVSNHELIAVTDEGVPAEVHAFALADGRHVVAAWLPPPDSAAAPRQPVEDVRRARVQLTLAQSSLVVKEIETAPAARARPTIEARAPLAGKGTALSIPLEGSSVVVVVLE